MCTPGSLSPKEIVEQWLWRKHIEGVPSTYQLHEGVILGLLKVVSVERGRVVCSFRVPSYLTNSSQTLHEGVIASIVDNVGAAVFVAIDGKIRVSVDLNVSYMFPAHIDVSFSFIITCFTSGNKTLGPFKVDVTESFRGLPLVRDHMDDIVVEAKLMNYGVPIGVVVVDLKNHNSGKLIAHGRHTMYHTSSKL